MVKILKHLEKKDSLLILGCLVFIVMQVWLDLKLPDYMYEITMLVQTEGSQMSDILLQGSYMLLCAVGSMGAAIIVGYFAAKVAAGFSVRLRAKVFEKTMSFSMEEINGFSTASLITRSTNDITQIQLLIAMGLQAIVKAPILAVWAIAKIMGKSWQWTAATGLAVAFLILLLSIVIFIAMPKFKIIQGLTDNLNRVTRENLTGIRVVRAYNAEGYQEAKFEKANEDLTKTNLFTTRLMALMQPSMGLIMSGISLSIYWIGAYLIYNAAAVDRLSLFSDMVVFSSYAMQVIMAFMLLSIVFFMLPRASVSAKRINEVLDTEAKILDGNLTAGKEGLAGEVEFKNVSFKYPDAADYILQNISFKAHPGETVAFIGSTGSGKSTLVNLIPRFYDASDGEVLVDGINVKEYSQEALHNKLGYVSQRAVLFSGTVLSNIAYGDNGEDIPDEEMVKKAIEIAQGQEFVEKMEGQYEASVSQGGTNFSGGQKQRLSIARAIARRPEIYLFDDSFSALDYKTDRVLRNALKKEIQNATMLIVAQRIGTIKDADRIIVLDQGKVAGSGTHEELMQTCSVYQEIAYSQLTKEELEVG
ncbi:multidrug ABC transporter ATP-binding protein [Robertmurraya siralis]|uniref:Multidrug ABC transporter ATP-binding protein n=1 Tax=Robertmurraya siralis TaxID=77777 RepID=A0A919WM45_9BACI|nr:ABC transporter ATP-binding protein [Robertmurraya siralis]PAE18962.1 multidrug ABC transporter ATP-binding protein [Bacillus sp. 7504-2]GIN64253.1 multidrug ABC transporter ATP-binding protein [Robertmurraya siralis]